MDRFSVVGSKMSTQLGELHHGCATACVLKNVQVSATKKWTHFSFAAPIAPWFAYSAQT